ncbi:hypothetical protein C2845_PM10G20560 [Panicum miliaceum]|uniref:DUF3615 domain-containing protein n=1 Tax=Panicum miliaceum TaxID=4540 RepID=A0A3L6PEG4_PANMI|nr:hypothetical protein C2845_PM10G20560 [Panicum miliaceum]
MVEKEAQEEGRSARARRQRAARTAGATGAKEGWWREGEDEDYPRKVLPTPHPSSQARSDETRSIGTFYFIRAPGLSPDNIFYARLYFMAIGRFLIDVEPLDSHTFDRRAEDPKDNNAYYHVNFQAKLGTCNSQPSLFFAELQGKDGPEKVNICTEISWSGILANGINDESQSDNSVFKTYIIYLGLGGLLVGCIGGCSDAYEDVRMVEQADASDPACETDEWVILRDVLSSDIGLK